MGVRLAAEDGFQPPSTADFELPPVFGDNPYTTKPVFLVFFSVILISIFFILASRKALVVPANCSFDGTTKAFLEAKMKNTEIKIMEKETKNTGLVV